METLGSVRLLVGAGLGLGAALMFAPRLKRMIGDRKESPAIKFETPADMQAVIPEPPSYAPA